MGPKARADRLQHVRPGQVQTEVWRRAGTHSALAEIQFEHGTLGTCRLCPLSRHANQGLRALGTADASRRTSTMMRILYMATVYPLPVNNGVKMRVWSLLCAIANAGHEITLATFAEPKEAEGTEQAIRKVCKDSDIVVRRLTSLS